MRKRATLFSNICIAVVIISLGAIVFTTDLNHIFLTVSAPIYSGNRREANVSLMINVDNSVDVKYVIEMKEILGEFDVDATFFVTGSFVLGQMRVIRDLASKFEIGNHGFSGVCIRNKREREQRAQIWNTHEIVRSITANSDKDGVEMDLFAPPMGSFGRTTLRVAERLGYTTIMWSRDATDKLYGNSDLVFQRATVNVLNGDIILFRPDAHTVGALPQILEYFVSRDFSIVRVSENIRS